METNLFAFFNSRGVVLCKCLELEKSKAVCENKARNDVYSTFKNNWLP